MIDRRCLLGFLAAGLALPRTGVAAPFVLPQIEYAAERFVQQGERWQNMAVRYAPGMERLEMQGNAAAGNVLILRHDLGQAWLVMPRMRALAELPAEVLERLGQAFRGTDLKAIGTETVNGVTAVKHRASGSFTGTVWLSRSGIPVKLAGERRTENGPRKLVMEQTAIMPGPQEGTLFEPPTGLMRIRMTDPAWLALLSDLIG